MKKYKKGDVLMVYDNEDIPIRAVYLAYLRSVSHHKVQVIKNLASVDRKIVWYLSDGRIVR